MRIAIESTPHLTTIDGVPVRLWEGVTEGGVPVKVFVHLIASRDDADSSELDRELSERLPPASLIGLRSLLP